MKHRLLFLINFVLAFCSIGYEFAIARSLTEMTGRGSQAQALTVAFYILGLGVGAGFAKDSDNNKILRRLVGIEIALALMGALSISLIQIFHLISYANFISDVYFLIAAQLISLIVGTLSGAELPYLLSLTRSSSGEKPTLLVLALNYFGAMVSSVICIYIFFPTLSGSQIAWTLSLLNLLAAVLLLGILGGSKVKLQIASTAAALVLVVFGFVFPHLDYKYLQYYYSLQLQVDATDSLGNKIAALDESVGVERTRTSYQVLDFVKRRFSDVQDGQLTYLWEDFLYINGQVQLLIGKDTIYHELMAHVPLALSKQEPTNVLILGGGDGILAKEILRQPNVKSVKLVEIDPQMIKLASTRASLVKANSDVFANPKVTTVLSDAYVFVRTDINKYDAVYIDLPFPFDEDLNKLYSFEFYANVLRLMSPQAFMVIDYPLNRGERVREVIYHTLKKAGLENIAGFGERSTFVIATRAAVALTQEPDHSLLSDQSRSYNVVHSQIFSSLRYDPRKANSSLHPLLVGH